MNLQTLKYFVSLSEERNFTKAAEACFVSQPALSRAISQFERFLGCNLVNRNGRTIELTQEGEICLIEAKKVIKQCNALIDKVTGNIEMKEPLRIGYIIYGHIVLFNKKLNSNPIGTNLKLEIQYDTLKNIYNKLSSNEIDIAILPEVCINDINYKTLILEESKLYVIIPRINPLFNRSSVTFEDLKSQRFIGWDPDEVLYLSDAHRKACNDNGFIPEFVAYAQKMGDLMTLSILHNAIGFGSCNSTIVDTEEFKLTPVSDSKNRFGLACIWNKKNNNPTIKSLINILS